VNAVPNTVFGLAAYNGAEHLAEAIESLLTQTRSDLSIVVVDDASTDATSEICARYAHLDPRVSFARNDRQLGLVLNWRRAFELAGERHPGARYFAWASDHDVWGARWLERLAAELDGHPEAVLAYPLAVQIDDAGSEYPTRERVFDTAGVADPRERVRRVGGELRGAGELIYGLMRRSAVERCGPFPLAVLADRLYLVRLALEGEFEQVRERLWYRRFRAGVAMSNARQRRTAFPQGAPLTAYVPWWLTHPVLFARSTGSAALTADLVRESVRTAYGRRRERVRRRWRWRRRHALERLGIRQRPVETPVSESAPLLDPGADVLELGTSELRPVDVALSRGFFERLSDEELEACLARLHELGVPEVYSLDHESAALREALGRRYWLRQLWVGSGGRKPDPNDGPVPRAPGELRHLVGRRRLIPEARG
jgi:glycosyltransferase involved in cell wall biosynthesis